MSSDAAYRARYLAAARTLWDCSKGNPRDIPSDYTEHLSHSYVDGDISLVSAIDRFEFAETLEPEEWDEAVELLSKVSEDDWPFLDDITSINAEELLHIYDEDASDFEDFVEDNLGTAEKIEKGLAAVIQSVLGEPVDNIRGAGGGYPNSANNFLQQPDGTFAGSFKHGDHKFSFEIFPDENGWTVTYRLDAATLDGLPPLHNEDRPEDDGKKKNQTKSIRNRSW
jgi:hypothetical protein